MKVQSKININHNLLPYCNDDVRNIETKDQEKHDSDQCQEETQLVAFLDTPPIRRRAVRKETET